MTLGPGARLGPYEIQSVLGVGGMGEVYRARDTRLKRDVAIKILPESFATDSERIARFEREAEVLASLNDPHIAQIYGVEESERTRALVLELVEGETLADRIARGPIPMDDVLAIASQIADALEAAHERGVTHRDLKPGNIKVRPDGTVKVLDFGLAKLAEPSGPSIPKATLSPTITSPALMTGVGVLLGTAAYMSPEQAKGRAADKRSDIWAFGCVLYEMVTGRRAFSGEDVADTLAFVLTKEPDWNAVPETTPVAIKRLLRRSLKKDRRLRLPDIADARIEIKDAADDGEAIEHTATMARKGLGSRERVAWVGIVVLGVGITAAVSIARSYLAPADNVPEMRVDIVTPSTPEPASFALSPDGRQLVFVGSSSEGTPRLWVRPLDALMPQVLPGTEGARAPFWSPDSRAVGFFADGRLKRIDMGGGAPRVLTNAAPGMGGMWTPDGSIVFAPTTTSPLFRVPANGGEATALTKLDPPRQAGHLFPALLPGGRQFLFYARGTEAGQGIYVGSLDSPETARLTAADSSAGVFLSPGWLLFVRQGALVAQRFDQSRRLLSGDPILVADSVISEGQLAAYGQAAVSTSMTGIVGYRAGGGGQTQLTWFDRSGKVLGTFGERDENALYGLDLSPEGGQVAGTRRVESNADIWLLDSARSVRFTFDAAIDQYPVWSPDGKWIAFSSLRKGPSNLYRKPASGAGSEELLFESPEAKNLDDWSPDGRFLLYNAEDSKTGRDLWVLPLEGDRKPFVFLKTSFEEHRGQFSPDGRWIAYVSNESGRPEIYIRSFPEPGGQWQVSNSGGIQPRWDPGGKAVYYIAPTGQLMEATIAVKERTIEPGPPTALFQSRVSGGGTNTYTRPQYDITRDGRFLVNVTTGENAASPITLLLNWRPRR